MKFILSYLSIVLCLACSENGDPLSPEKQRPNLGIYFLKDTLLTVYQAEERGINNLELKDEPWLSAEDIDSYDYSSHCIYLNKDKSHFFDISNGRFIFKDHLIHKPFVFIAESERCYIGSFHSIVLSSLPNGPYINEFDLNYYPIDILHISGKWTGGIDHRINPKLKETLIKNNQYHAGLEVELTNIKITDNSDTSTIEYTIRIKNNDHDDLLVIDSDKIGSELFHYYSNSPVLKNENNFQYFFPSQKVEISPGPIDSWDNWVTLIKSKESIRRPLT